jgi:hypothetical protein
VRGGLIQKRGVGFQVWVFRRVGREYHERAMWCSVKIKGEEWQVLTLRHGI